MQYLRTIIIIITIVPFALAANILAFSGTDLKSHMRVVASILEHLSPYHNITFYVNPDLNYSNKNITVRNYLAPTTLQKLDHTLLLKNPCEISPIDIFYKYILHDNETHYDVIYSQESMQLLLNSDEKYDVLIMSGYGSDFVFPIAHRFKTPIIQVSPSIIFPWISEAVGSPFSWDADVSFMISDTSETFIERLKKYLKNAYLFNRFHKYFMPTLNRGTLKYFPPGTPAIEDIMKTTELVFVNTHTAMGYGRPTIPTVVEVGGVHLTTPKPLPEDLEEFIAGSGEHGFIYFSLGTVVQELTLPEEKKVAILNTFRRLPQRVLWKWGGSMEDVPENVKISKWFPQADILRHKRIKLLITHGGILSLQEASYYGIPSLIMPLLFDQFTNGYLANKKGYSQTLDFCSFSEQLFYEKIKELLGNPSYRQKAKQMAKVIQYQHKEIPQKINYWVNFVIENNGTSSLRPLLSMKTWMQTTPADIFAVLFLIVTIGLVLFLFAIVQFWSIITMNSPKTKIN